MGTMCWQGCEEAGTFVPHSQKAKKVLLLWKTLWQCPRNLNTESLYDLTILLDGPHTNK